MTPEELRAIMVYLMERLHLATVTGEAEAPEAATPGAAAPEAATDALLLPVLLQSADDLGSAQVEVATRLLRTMERAEVLRALEQLLAQR